MREITALRSDAVMLRRKAIVGSGFFISLLEGNLVFLEIVYRVWPETRPCYVPGVPANPAVDGCSTYHIFRFSNIHRLA